MRRTEQKIGGLYGLLVGDALGVPYEFSRPGSVPWGLVEMTPPRGYDRAHQGTPVGTWSDDGAQALCLLASLLDRGKLDIEDFAGRLIGWRERGYMAVDGRVFDIGIQTSGALSSMMYGTNPHLSGPNGERDNGNGSLMRVLPLALWHEGTDMDLVTDAHLQSLPTHGHFRSQVCCAVYCMWARELMEGTTDVDDAMDNAIARVRAVYEGEQAGSVFLEELALVEDAVWNADATGSGYVLDCLVSAFAIQGDSYEDTVRAAIVMGNDTDTTACVAGGIAGIRFGLDGIPKRWFDSLRERETVERLIDQMSF